MDERLEELIYQCLGNERFYNSGHIHQSRYRELVRGHISQAKELLDEHRKWKRRHYDSTNEEDLDKYCRPYTHSERVLIKELISFLQIRKKSRKVIIELAD